jgi:hypothetical protein
MIYWRVRRNSTKCNGAKPAYARYANQRWVYTGSRHFTRGRSRPEPSVSSPCGTSTVSPSAINGSRQTSTSTVGLSAHRATDSCHFQYLITTLNNSMWHPACRGAGHEWINCTCISRNKWQCYITIALGLSCVNFQMMLHACMKTSHQNLLTPTCCCSHRTTKSNNSLLL